MPENRGAEFILELPQFIDNKKYKTQKNTYNYACGNRKIEPEVFSFYIYISGEFP